VELGKLALMALLVYAAAFAFLTVQDLAPGRTRS
jgi:hypothetical protein